MERSHVSKKSNISRDSKKDRTSLKQSQNSIDFQIDNLDFDDI